jgi:hypothetical protein
MSWQDQLPPLDDERLYRRVIAAGETRRARRREKRHTVVALLALVIGLAGVVGLFAALPDDEETGDAADSSAETTTGGAAATTGAAEETTGSTALPVGVVVAQPSVIWETAPGGAEQCGPAVTEVRYRHDAPILTAELSWTVAGVTNEAAMEVTGDSATVLLGPLATGTAPGSYAEIGLRVEGIAAEGEPFSVTGSATLNSCPPR